MLPPHASPACWPRCLADLLGLKSRHPATRHAVHFRICKAWRPLRRAPRTPAAL